MNQENVNQSPPVVKKIIHKRLTEVEDRSNPRVLESDVANTLIYIYRI
jgi:hypothetical protein